MKQKIIFRPRSKRYLALIIFYSVFIILFGYGIVLSFLERRYISSFLSSLVCGILIYQVFELINYNIKITDNYILAPIPRLYGRACRYKIFKKQTIYFLELGKNPISNLNLEKKDGLDVISRWSYPFINLLFYTKNGEPIRIDILYFSAQQREEIIKIINERLKENHLGEKDEFAGN